MRKLFFFRSAPTGENSNPETPSSISNKINDKVDNNSRRGKDLLSRSQKQFPGSQNSVTNTDSSGLTRSLSFSSAAFYSGDLGEKNLHCLNDPSRSPSTISDVPPQLFDYPVRCHSRTPEKLQSKAKRSEETTTRKAYGVEKPDSPGGYHDSSGNSSCSSDMLPVKCGSTHLNQTSNRILDLYIDGEQQQERNLKPKISSFQRNLPNNGNGGGWRRQVQSTAPASPTDSKGRARSYSFGEMREANVILLTRDRKRNEFEPEPPQKLAKNVVERLSKVFPQKPKTRSRRDLNPDTPTTIEDISEDSSDPHPHSNSNGVALKSCLSDGPYGTLNGCHGEDISGFQKHNCFLGDVPVALHSVQTEDDVDVELHRKAKEAEERVLFLSEELEQENFLQDNSGFSVSALLQMIRKLTEERRNLALEVSAQFQCQIAERASANEALKAAKVELDSQTWRLEKEKNEWQSRLEKELDKRSREWSFKLDKYQSEEQRSRERVRELAEQNICLQREVSSLNGRDTESRSRITYSDLQLKDLMARLEEAEGENQDLRKAFSELQGCFRAAEADWDCIQRAYKEKEKENKELQKALTRLQRTCSDQEKTIGGLRQGLVEEVERKQSFEKFDKLQMEQVRLTGVEQILRREMESYRLEVESLRRENINLLDRLGATGNDGGSLSFKLDQELLARVDCLQKQGLSLLNESSQLCIKLLESIKGKAGQIVEVEPHSKQGQEAQNGLDVYFVVESDMKVQSLKNGIENLTISLQTIASVVHEKSNPISSESQSQCKEGCGLGNGVALEDDIGFKLKAETLVTSVLREKLCSKELEIEQLQAEVATVVRGHDILRCEVQSAQDALSCVTHKMKELELQIMRKDESINKLKCDLQQCTKELTITRGILPKVSGERDLMWEEVKQYSEKNMLLNSEVNLLKKKIESLDEDVLLKEGQIQILKDSLSSKHFDILCSPKSMQEFMLK